MKEMIADQEKKEQNNNKKEIFLVLVLLMLGIALRFVPLNSILYTDDIVVMNIAEQKYLFAPANVNPHPPLGNVFLIISTMLFGISEWTFRLPAFLFSVATLVLIYFFTKNFINEKAARWSLFFAALSGWHIYSAATNIGGEGILAFFLLLASYYFLKYIYEDSPKKHIFIGILIAGASFFKETSVLLAPIFLLYLVISKVKIKEAIKKLFFISLGVSLSWLIFIAADFVFNDLQAISNLIELMIRTGVERSGYIQPGFFQYLFSFFKVAVWITPFFIFITFLWVFCRKKQSEPHTLHENVRRYLKISLIIYTSFFLIYISPAFDKSRYLLIIAPFLFIISGEYLSRFTFTKKDQLSLLLLLIFFFSLFFIINRERNIISFDQQEKIIENMRSFQLNFDVGLISETGNAGFVVNLRVAIIAYALAFIFVIGYLLYCRYQTSFFILFFAVGFAFNLFIAQEYLFHLTAPNYGAVSRELHQYALENDIKEPIYLFKDPSMAYYLKTKYHEFYNFDVIQNPPERIQKFKSLVYEKGGSVLLIDIPFVDKEGMLWQFLQTCQEKKTFSDKDIVVGYLFDCSNQKRTEE